MTEAQARAAPRRFVAVGDLGAWTAEQPWQAVPGGWRVRERFDSWHFRVEPVPGGVRVVMSGIGGQPAVWIVPSRPAREAT